MNTRGVESTALIVGLRHMKLTVVTHRYKRHIIKPTQSLALEETNPARHKGNNLIKNNSTTNDSILFTIA